MNQLLRLFILQHFKRALKCFVVSVIMSAIFTYVVKEQVFFGGVFFFIYICYALASFSNENPYGANLSWIATIPVSKKQLILHNAFHKCVKFLTLYSIPLLVLIADLIWFKSGILKQFRGDNLNTLLIKFFIEENAYIPSSVVALIIFIIFLHFISLSSFGYSQADLERHQKRKDSSLKDLFIKGCIILSVYFILNLFNFTILILFPTLTFLIFFHALYRLKEKNIFPQFGIKTITIPPLIFAVFYFSMLKIYSDKLLQSNKNSISQQIAELDFQGAFAKSLPPQTFVNIISSGLNYHDYKLLKENSTNQWSMYMSYINEHKFELFTELMTKQNDNRMVHELITFFDYKNIKREELELYFKQLNKNAQNRYKMPMKVLTHLDKTALNRQDLMQYLISEDPFKNYYAIYRAWDKTLKLEAEIIKNLVHFSDESLDLAKNILSEHNCRAISSAEMIKLGSKKEIQINSNCKK